MHVDRLMTDSSQNNRSSNNKNKKKKSTNSAVISSGFICVRRAEQIEIGTHDGWW